MNAMRFLFFSLIVLFILFFLAMPEPEIGRDIKARKNIDLPWNIKINEDKSTEVFKLKPGISSLADAIARFHEPEEIAVYAGNQKQSLEAYMGNVSLGPLQAKMILTLAATEEELQTMINRSAGISLSGSEDKKLKLAPEDIQASLNRTVSSITFIPKYSGLDSEFFKERLGEPHAWQRLGEQAVQYYYPEKGLSVIIDADGKDVLEYNHPKDFVLPQDVELNPEVSKPEALTRED